MNLEPIPSFNPGWKIDLIPLFMLRGDNLCQLTLSSLCCLLFLMSVSSIEPENAHFSTLPDPEIELGFARELDMFLPTL